MFLGFLVLSWAVHSILGWQYIYPALNFTQPHVNQSSSLNHQQTSNTLQNALGIETNCVIWSCSPGQAACSRFLWNPRELSFLHTKACCFHSSASFTIFFLYLDLVMVPSPELLLLMSFFHFFLCLQKLFSLCSDVESEIWEWWHFYWRISWHPTSNRWLKVYGMVLFCIVSSFLMISIC